MKKHTKWILCIITVIIIAIAVIWTSFYYVTNYKKTICDMSASSDGKYELSLLAVGEPEWPFGSATGQLILKEGKDTISKTSFELRNDGGMINRYCWKVTWNDEYVEVIISGKEQFDEQIILFFDGKKEIQQLTDKE